MAIFTEISDEDRNSVAAAYGMTSLSSMTGIADGDRSGVANFRLRHDDVLFSEIAGVLVSWADLPKGELHEQCYAGEKDKTRLLQAKVRAFESTTFAAAARQAECRPA
ncbi:hypothetical protein [Rhizobium giardinii]|uniref:Uncharacterized protein n=1 Tax=Rhizobium giardinii TaxID=56731 RepID=A0A7W8UAW3_9HYPH|nr:hypothetical protein [Rhizobium giardinii]MBB5536032.1 hypothetical protein [Rhizobium giardinii]